MQLRRSSVLSLLLAAVVFAGCAAGQRISEVPDLVPSEDGTSFFMEHQGVKWQVFEDPEQNRAWFMNTETQDATWEDPRGNFADQTVEALPPPVPKGSKTTVYMVALIPVILFVGALFGRIYYLHVNYPELLWPTKERKARAKSGAKFKPQKARGKMSQDGKGGRSANS